MNDDYRFNTPYFHITLYFVKRKKDGSLIQTWDDPLWALRHALYLKGQNHEDYIITSSKLNGEESLLNKILEAGY